MRGRSVSSMRGSLEDLGEQVEERGGLADAVQEIAEGQPVEPAKAREPWPSGVRSASRCRNRCEPIWPAADRPQL